MTDDRRSESTDLIFSDFAEFVRSAGRYPAPAVEPRHELPINYRIAFGLEVIQLSGIEFRILMLLAGRPYHPFSRKQIAESVSTELEPVAEQDVDDYVTTLREQLHGFRDYVQAVPYSGYRFKA